MNLLAAAARTHESFSAALHAAPNGSDATGGGAGQGAMGRPPLVPPQLLTRVRQLLKDRHYSARTEAATLEWIHRFFAFHGGRPAESLGEAEVRAFLEDLGERAGTSVAARNQARTALLLLFHGVLGQRFDCTVGLARAQDEGRGPVALTRLEMQALLGRLSSNEPALGLLAGLLYGSGLRLAEVCMLRVRDIDLAAGLVYIRGTRERTVEARCVRLPDCLVEPLRQHLVAAQVRHRAECSRGAGFVAVPEAVRLKDGGAGRSWPWQWVFPAARLKRDPLSREGRRQHQHEAVVQRALLIAAREAGLAHAVNAHTLRHCFAAHLLDRGVGLSTVQALLGVGPADAIPAALPRSPLDL